MYWMRASLINDSNSLHAILVELTDRYLPETCLHPFLNIAEILASFHACVKVPVFTDVQNIMVRGLAITTCSSFKTRGCTPSGPADFDIFNF